MDNVTYDTENKSASLATNTLKMPSWLLEMTEYVVLFCINVIFHLFKNEYNIVFHFFLFSSFILYISNIEKININNNAKLLQMETFLIDDQYHFKNITIKKQSDDT